jgi:hypothetical protein
MIQGANEPSVIWSAETWAKDLLQDLNQLTVSAVWKWLGWVRDTQFYHGYKLAAKLSGNSPILY